MNPNLQDAQRYEQLAKQDPKQRTFWLNTAKRMRTKFRDFVPEAAQDKPHASVRIHPNHRVKWHKGKLVVTTPLTTKQLEQSAADYEPVIQDMLSRDQFHHKHLNIPQGTFLRVLCYAVQNGYTVKRKRYKYSKGKYYLYTLNKLSSRTYQKTP